MEISLLIVVFIYEVGSYLKVKLIVLVFKSIVINLSFLILIIFK